ncbi:MAG: hypothetical protein COA45_05470 [Zetaproteobacteria bacterium]|nr:MAG: hypothetical protein COA45_05470 [Zetaproteobacteria bacterium]
MGRQLEFDIETVLESATDVFWAKGYKETSLQDLLRAMGLSKSSFYQTFENKHNLFQRCLNFYGKRVMQGIMRRLDKAESAEDFIESYFSDIVEGSVVGAEKRGCMYMNTASGLAQNDLIIEGMVKDGLNRVEKVFQQVIEQGQKEGSIPLSKDPTVLSGFLTASAGGMKTMVKVGVDKEKLRNIASTIIQSIKE